MDTEIATIAPTPEEQTNFMATSVSTEALTYQSVSTLLKFLKSETLYDIQNNRLSTADAIARFRNLARMFHQFPVDLHNWVSVLEGIDSRQREMAVRQALSQLMGSRHPFAHMGGVK